MKAYDLYQFYKPETLKDLLDYCAETSQEKEAFRCFVRKKEYCWTYAEFRKQVNAVSAWLLSSGETGRHVAVLGENSYEWILIHFAVTCSRNVIVPIDRNLSTAEVDNLLKESDCSVLFCSDQYDDIARQLTVSDLEIIMMSQVEQIIHEGEMFIAGHKVDSSRFKPEKDDLASIVFTSGTTGKSKGVMLTHGNFAADTYGSCCNVQLKDEGLLVLPLHHTFGLVAGVFSPMLQGCPICINHSLKNISKDIQKYRPQHMFIVPMIAEQFNQRIWNSVKKKGKGKALRKLLRVSNFLLKFGMDLRYRLYKEIHDAFGGNLRLLICGGAPIDEDVIKSLWSFGFIVLNGYGITECGPVVAVNRNKYIVPESVGLPLVCNTVKISDDGEILVRGENVMQGYYHMEQETEEVFQNGWFSTGDLGQIDEQGALHITGRIKNLIILKNGENIPAETLETELMKIPEVKEVIVYGKDDVITAEVYPDPSFGNCEQRIRDAVARINRELPQNRNIADLIFRSEPFPKTTTLKIKRDGRK